MSGSGRFEAALSLVTKCQSAQANSRSGLRGTRNQLRENPTSIFSSSCHLAKTRA